jgi:xanthine dehydrogenase iron-sulfur cluster and FAD-binding subunit A
MKQIKKILEELTEICNKLDIKVRFEKTTAKGGLCKVNDKYMIIIDRKATDEYKANVIANSLKKFDIENLHLKPKVRDFIDNA